MSQTDAENSRLPPKRPLGSFHLLCDHCYRRSSFRMLLETRTRRNLSMASNDRSLFAPLSDPPVGFGWAVDQREQKGRPLRRVEKSPRTRCRQARGKPARSGGGIQRVDCVTMISQCRTVNCPRNERG